MVSEKLFRCIDAGTENCPCYLATCNHCLTCSKLQGKECSGCDWKGVCIYNEFIQNGKQIKNIRKEQRVKVLSKRIYQEDTFVFVLQVEKGMALKCMTPGTFVLLRNADYGEYYSVPISIMKADPQQGEIHVAIKQISAKTGVITLIEEGGELLLKGPYKNGLFGLENLNEVKNGKVLILSKGIGIAPTVKLAHFLNGKTEFFMKIDTAKVGEEIANDYLNQWKKQVSFVDFIKEEMVRDLEECIKVGEYGMVAIFASDYFIAKLGALVKECSNDAMLLVSNNFNICCGEGICGACSVAGESGETIKMCKCQLSGEDIVRRNR